MKKKILMMLSSLAVVLFLFTGCSGLSINNCISEITFTYFKGQDSSSASVYASISVGEREEPYKMDGKHRKNVDFALINLILDDVSQNEVMATIDIDGTASEIMLEFNPRTSSYMADLGYAISGDSTINLKVDNYSIDFSNISKDFKVDYNKALEIGEKLLSENVTNFSSSNFDGEIYLKLFTMEGSDVLYWIYTAVYEDGVTYNFAINVNDENDVYVD